MASGSPDRRRSHLHLGLLTTLPPSPTGPAEFVAGALPELARACRITCFVDKPDSVDPALREQFRILPLSERDDPSIDLLVYHIANNLHQVGVYDAAMAGPPGLLEIHDGSVHHALATRMLASDNVDAYRDQLARTHGPRGDQLARLRLGGQPAGIELFMFDALGDLLDHHLGAVVHNRYASELLALRAPELPTWIVPLSAQVPAPAMPKQELGLPADRLVIAHFGFVTRPKRPFLLLAAFARLRAANPAVHLLFAGEDDTAGQLDAEIEQLHLEGAVTVTGYLERERMDALISSVDIVVSLRFPHVGETSATLGAALAAGRPVVIQETGSWAELPPSAVLAVPSTGDEETGLADALTSLVNDPLRRTRLGGAARAYAARRLGAERYAAGVADAAMAVSLGSRVPPARYLAERRAAVERLMSSERLTLSTLLAEGWPRRHHAGHVAALSQLPPGRAGAWLLDLGGGPAVHRLLECVWGYNVTAGGQVQAALPYPTGGFHVVAAWDGLPRAPESAVARLAEINRVLRAGGLLVLADPELAVEAVSGLLQRAGLSPDAVRAPAGPANGAVAVARKVALPALASMH